VNEAPEDKNVCACLYKQKKIEHNLTAVYNSSLAPFTWHWLLCFC